MAIRKINSGYQQMPEVGLQDLKQYFPDGFEHFFDTSIKESSQEEAEFYYVQDQEGEEKVREVLDCGRDACIVLTGYSGSGKSTLLRHCLKGYDNTIKIEDRKLKAPLFFREYFICPGEEFEISRYICRINEKLEEEYPELAEYFFSKQGAVDFARFFDSKRPDVLTCQEEMQHIPQNLELSQNGQLKEAKNRFPAVYEAVKLQFLLAASMCPVEDVVISIDDTDQLSYSRQKEILVCFLSLFESLRTFPKQKMESCYRIKLVLSIRTDSYFRLRGEREFKTHRVNYEIYKDGTINLEKYMSRRLKTYTQKKENQNIQVWRECLQQFGRISQRFNGKYDNLIKGITFYQVQESLLLYAKILCNQRWVRRTSHAGADDYFRPDNYVLNNISVIRAVTCGENDMFVNAPDNYAVNLLYNTAEKNYSILCLYMIGFLYRRGEKNRGSRRSGYGKRELILLFTEIFPTVPHILEDVREVITYLCRYKVLLKETIREVNASAGQKDVSNVYLHLSPKGAILWDMLHSDSVLMELCREDYYREYESCGCCNNPYSSYHLMMTNQQKEIFMDLCRILEELIGLEESYLSAAENSGTMEALRQAFGHKMMCGHLMEGVENSMDFSGLKRDPDVNEYYSEITAKLHTL